MGRGKGQVAAGATLRSRSSSQAAPAGPVALTVEDIRSLCSDYDMDLSPALEDNRFYHVTTSDRMEGIARNGLRPSKENDTRNFEEYHIDEDCVYLWPSIGNAQVYIYNHEERFHGRDRIILQTEGGVDLSLLAPDHEDFARYWEEDDEDDPVLRLASEESGVKRVVGEPLDPEKATEILRSLSPQTSALLANMAASRGDAVMVRSALPPGTLSAATLNDYEQLGEQFDEEHPELNPWRSDEYDEDVQEAHDEAFESWLQARADETGGELRLTDPGELQDLLESRWEELVENEELHYFNLRPLQQAGASLAAAA